MILIIIGTALITFALLGLFVNVITLVTGCGLEPSVVVILSIILIGGIVCMAYDNDLIDERETWYKCNTFKESCLRLGGKLYSDTNSDDCYESCKIGEELIILNKTI